MLDNKKISRHIVAALTVYAFGNSYLHGVDWVQEHSSNDVFAWGTAGIPELILISTLLRGKFDLKAVVGGASSIGWTFWVNGASAGPGVSGMVVALAPPFAAVMCAWFLESDEPVKPTPTRKPRSKLQDRQPKKLSKFDQGLLWAEALPVWPTTADIMKQFPDISRTTADKIRRSKSLVSN